VLAIAVMGSLIMIAAATVAGLLRPGRGALLLAVGAVAFFISAVFLDVIWQAIWQRVTDNVEEGQGRVFTSFTNAFQHFEVAGALGFGTGAANLGAPALAPDVAPFSWLPIGNQFEEESGRIVLELGIIGWVIGTLLRVAVLGWAIQLLVTGRTRMVRLAAVLALPFAALALYQGQGVFAPTYHAVVFWFGVALLAMAEGEQRQAATLVKPQVRARPLGSTASAR
jgi:hypothetical protein